MLFAAVAVDGAAAGHSWQYGMVVGLFDKGSLRCDATTCKALVTVERVGYFRGGYADAPTTMEVTFSNGGSAIDHKAGERWSSAREALTHLADKDRVWLTGGVDCGTSCSSLILLGWDVMRLAPLPPGQPVASGGPLFPACGSPPWTYATLVRCVDPNNRDRRVTVTARLLTKPFTEFYDLRAVLSLRAMRIEVSGVEMIPPVVDEVATVMPTAKVHGATPSRPKVASLQRGDIVVLEGYYRGHERPSVPCGHCKGPYWPHLVVDRAITFQKLAGAP